MRKLIHFSYFIIFCLSANSIVGQELLINGDSKIKDISINKDGRLHLLYSDNLCVFEGKQLVEKCYSLQNKISHILPIEDGFYALFYENKIELIRHNKLLRKDSFPNSITAVSLFAKEILIGTSGSGLFKYNLNNFHQEFIGLENEFINSLMIHYPNVYIAQDDGISRYNLIEKEFSKNTLSQIISKLSIIDKDNIIAICEDGYVYKLDSSLKLLNQKLYPQIKIKEISNSFFTTSNACYQFDSLLNIIKIIDGQFSDLLELPNTLLLSSENNLYTIDLTVKSIKTNDKVYSIYSENNTTLWIGTTNQIHKYKDDTLAFKITIPTKLPKVAVSSLLVTSDLIFAGTMGDGLFILNKKGELLKNVLDNKENNRNNIIQLSYKDNIVWVAYLNGITKIDLNTLLPIEEFDTILGNNYLYCLEPISETEFYIGTSSLGLLHYKNGIINTYLEKEIIYSLSSTASGLLVGTKDNGVYLQNDSKTTILDDKISTRSIAGINDMTLLISKEKNQFYWNGVIFPIANNNFKNAQLNAITENNYSIIVGYENGFLKVNKERLNRLKEIGLHLNRPLLFDELIPEGKNSFDYSENSLTFSFHQNTYYNASNTNYKYRLLGLDSNWQQTQQSKLNFYNLNSGNYVFEVASSFADNTNLINKQKYVFTIRKPFWKTNWFIVLITIIGVLVIFFVIKAREKRLLRKGEQEQEKMRFVLEKLKNQINPHFLFNSFNSLVGLIEENPQSAIEATQLLSDLYRNILTYEKLDLISLHEELNLAKNYFHMHQIRFEDLVSLKIDVSDKDEGKLIPLSCQFLIENAIKHNIINQDNRLHILIKQENNYLHISNTYHPKQIKDSEVSGLGLNNLKARYSHFTNLPLLIEISSSIFTVKIPIVYDSINNN